MSKKISGNREIPLARELLCTNSNEKKVIYTEALTSFTTKLGKAADSSFVGTIWAVGATKATVPGATVTTNDKLVCL